MDLFCVRGQFSFISLEYCSLCCLIFVKCTQCNLCRKQFYKNGRDFLKVHVKLHQSNLLSNEEQNFDTIETDDTSLNNTIASTDLFDMFSSTNLKFGRNECVQYLQLMIENDSESWSKMIHFSLSSHYCNLFKTMDESSKQFNNIIQLHSIASTWINNLSKKNREYFCSFVHQLKKCFPSSVGNQSLLPHLYKDLCNTYFDGKNYVLSKVSYPTFRWYNIEYVYIQN